VWLAWLLKPSWVPIDDTTAMQLFPNFQIQQSKALQVMMQKVAKPLPAKAVLFYFQLHYSCDLLR
jgi:hypothetical protein